MYVLQEAQKGRQRRSLLESILNGDPASSHLGGTRSKILIQRIRMRTH